MQDVLAFIARLQRSPAASLAQPLPPPAEAALDMLREVEAAVAGALEPPSNAQRSGRNSAAPRLRAALALVRWLQLHVLGAHP